MRRRIPTLISVLALSALLTACGTSAPSQPAPSQDQPAQPAQTAQPAPSDVPKEIRIGYQVIPNTEAVVRSEGWLEERLGTKVIWKEFDSGVAVNKAMAAGEIDIGLAGSAAVASGLTQGLPYEVFWIYDAIGDNEALVVKKNSGITKASDLIGKKVATPFGSTSHYHLLKYLEAEGVDAKQVQIVNLQPMDMLAAWQRGDIVGGWVWQPVLQKMADSGGTLLFSSRKMAEKGVLTGDIGVVAKDFAAKYPKVVSKYLAAENDAVKLYRSNQDEAVKAVAKEFRISDTEAKEIMGQLIWLNADEQLSDKYLGRPGQVGQLAQVLKSSADFLKTQGSIKESPDLGVFQKGINPQYLSDAMKQ